MALSAPALAQDAPTTPTTPMVFSDMVRMAQSGDLESVDVFGDTSAVAHDKKGHSFDVRTPFAHTWAMKFAEEGVKVEFKTPATPA